MPTQHAQQMNELVRGQRTAPTTGQRKTDEIHGYYKQGLQQIRGTRNMHPDAQRVEIARLYATTQAALKKVKRDQAEADTKAFTKLERKLWGYDLERATASDRATLDATIRDAQDRAAKLAKPEHAARALADAEQAGDHILARAIGKRAHEKDWSDVVHDYLAPRTSSAQAYQEAGEIWHRHNTSTGQLHDSMQYVVHKPQELRGMADQDVQAMADPTDNTQSAA